MRLTIKQIKSLKETEDKIEFKEAKNNFSFAGSKKTEQKERRKCFLGYIVALANEKGGHLVLGVKENLGRGSHTIVGTEFGQNKLGALEDEVYNRLRIRVHIYELFEEERRVVVCEIPSRPIGKTLKFEGVPLMRSGDGLHNMSDEEVFSILSESEPDFSATIVKDLELNALDKESIAILKRAYARKQKNPQFLLINDEQALKDLDLLIDSGITYAALILLGSVEAIKRYLPQSQIRLEYRKDAGRINFDKRYIFEGSFYSWIDSLWETINLRNSSIPVQEGSYIFDVPFFNEEVIREAINNMIAHRDYRMQSECLVKQSDASLLLINPGGFPRGVTVENVLKVSSTPRNRLLTEVLQKTGIVERSGQGVDKIVYHTLKEGKPKPDYTKSDDYQVRLDLSATIEDKAFALFIQSYQSESTEDKKLSVFDVLYLKKIKKGVRIGLNDKSILKKLLDNSLIVKKGKTSGIYYDLSRDYYELTDQKGVLGRSDWGDDQAVPLIINYLQKYNRAKTRDFVDLFEGRLSRKQVRTILEKQLETGIIERKGKTSGAFYRLSSNYNGIMSLLPEILKKGIEQMNDSVVNSQEEE